jgi:outer membrane protein assembly factor BamB
VFESDAQWEKLPEGYKHTDVSDVAVDSRDRVYLLTRRDYRVIVYDREGNYLCSWGEGIFTNAHGLHIGPDDSIYCVDNHDHSVRKFTTEGELLMVLGTPGVPSDTGFDGRELDSIAFGGPPFNKCTNLAVGPNGDLFVSDGYGNARVHRFSADGTLIRSWGEPGTGPGQFHLVHGIWVAPDGRVLVGDRENDRVQVFSPDGEFLAEWTDMQRPCDIVIDRDGYTYVAELCVYAGDKSYVHGVATTPRPSRVGIFDPNGVRVGQLGTVGGCDTGEFVAAHGLAFDSRGDLYVAEVTWVMAGRAGLVGPDCHQIQKFTRRSAPKGGGSA